MESVIIPLAQAVILLAGQSFLVVLLPDSRVAAILTHFCDALGLDRWGQIKRIQAHPSLAKSLVTVQIETAKGERTAHALVAWAIPLWLHGVQITRLAEEKRPLILTLQEEAPDAFYRHFIKLDLTKSEPPPQPKEPVSEPSPRPAVEAPEEEPLSHWQLLYAGFSGLEQEQEMQNIQMAGMQARLTTLEAGAAHAAPAQAAAPGAPLTPAHQAQVWAFLRALQRQSGLHLEVIQQEFFARFGGQRVSQLPESAWQEVLLWFWRRLGW